MGERGVSLPAVEVSTRIGVAKGVSFRGTVDVNPVQQLHTALPGSPMMRTFPCTAVDISYANGLFYVQELSSLRLCFTSP